MLAPLVGGLIDDHFGWRLTFLLMAVIAGAILVMTAARLAETRLAANANTPVGVRHSVAKLMNIPAFWTYTLTSSFGSAVFYAFLAGTPFAAKYIYALSGARYGVFYVFVACGFLLGNYITGTLAPRFGLYRLIVTGNLICFFTILAMATSFFAGLNTPLVLFGAMLIVNFSNGLVMPNSLAGAMSIRPELAGSASGIAGSFQIAAGALAITVVGALVSPATFETAFVAVTLVFSAGALLTGLYTPRTLSRRDAAPS
jgi:DHA1 family bicyclomycin/chloramphenicol resistance-like MFS transporter